MIQRCITCEKEFPLDQVIYLCPACGSVLEIRLDSLLKTPVSPMGVGSGVAERFQGRGVWRYSEMLPVDAQGAITLSEGATGLHRCDRLGSSLGIEQLYIKNEGENPTGSFKDRGMTVGVTRAVELGVRAVACASTGNTSASMAAYAAKAGIRAIVLVPAGRIAAGKLAQAAVHGAKIVQVEGDFDSAMRLVQELSSGPEGIYLLNSINPFRLEGQKTLAFEVFETLGRVPDAVVLPMGNAGNISAIWKGFSEFLALGIIDRRPRMIGVQAEGASPIVRTVREGGKECGMVGAETVATAIRIGAPVNWRKAVVAIRESGGTCDVVSDAEILSAQKDLARLEGRFVEPASAAPIAYLRRYGLWGCDVVVCVATGHGLKDADAVLSGATDMARCEPTLRSLREALRTE